MIANVHSESSSICAGAAALPVTRPAFDLINTYSTRNLGDAAIMRSIASLVPGGVAGISLDRSGERDLPGLAFCDPRTGGVRISVGGDIFNNSRPSFVTRSFLGKLAELARAPRRTIAFGQTIPSSCRGMSFAMLSQILKRIPSVTVRDTESYELLNATGVKAALSWDAAFLTEPTVESFAWAAKLLQGSGLEAERTALISVRPFDGMYPGDQRGVERTLADLATALLDRGHQVALMIQSDVGAWDEDRTSALRIASADARIKIVDCLEDRDDTDPVATLTALLQLANIAIGIRYHTTVLRLAAGRTPFNLFYSRKGRDLQHRLGLAGCHIADAGNTATVKAIEATSASVFDPAGIRRDVRHHFAEALKKAAA